MSEWEFLAAVAEEANCGILLDINNIYVSAFNQLFDPLVYIDAIPVNRVAQFHLVGHSDRTYLLDTIIPSMTKYGRSISMRYTALESFPLLIEWDENIQEFAELATAAQDARRRFAAIYKNRGHHEIRP